MPDLGDRANVMGPQPIAPRNQPPAEMLAVAERVMDLMSKGGRAELEAMSKPDAREAVAAVAAAVPAALRNSANVTRQRIAWAHVNQHHYIKARLSAEGVAPFTFQVRLGELDGRWVLWEAFDLTGRRSGWSS